MSTNPGPKPNALPVIAENIPAEVRARPQWVCWRYLFRKGKWTKPPYQTNGENAKSNDPDTWTSFEAALAAYQAGGFDGIGYCLAADEVFTIGDLDDCRDAETGEVAPWASALIDGWPSYAEVSPSGAGFRLIGRGTKPGSQCGPKEYGTGKVEMYDQKTAKYLTFTGHARPGATAITDAQDHITRIYNAVFESKQDKGPKADRTRGPKPSANGKHGKKKKGPGDRKPYAELSDDDLLTLAREAENGVKFKALYDDGSLSYHFDDASRADAALCTMLAFWCRKDGERIDRLFRRSALFREGKWAERHRGDGATYGAMTVEMAVELCKEVYDPGIRVKMKGAGYKADEPGDPAADPADPPDWPPPAVIVLRNWLREKYGPTFRRGRNLYSASLGRDVAPSEVSACPTSEVLALLQDQEDAPRSRNGQPDPSLLPFHFRTWMPVAWADVAATLPEESESAEVVEPAREEFVRGLTAALVTMVPLAYRHTKDGQEVEEVQRRPVVEWAKMFARTPRWESVRGYRIWARKEGSLLRVALRVELLGQVHARALDGLSQKRLSELCVLYGVGMPCHVQGGQARATELTGEFLADLLAGPAEPDRQTDAGETHAGARESAS